MGRGVAPGGWASRHSWPKTAAPQSQVSSECGALCALCQEAGKPEPHRWTPRDRARTMAGQGEAPLRSLWGPGASEWDGASSAHGAP